MDGPGRYLSEVSQRERDQHRINYVGNIKKYNSRITNVQRNGNKELLELVFSRNLTLRLAWGIKQGAGNDYGGGELFY